MTWNSRARLDGPGRGVLLVAAAEKYIRLQETEEGQEVDCECKVLEE